METNTKKNKPATIEKGTLLKNIFQQVEPHNWDDLVAQLATVMCKQSFLVFKQHKYVTVPVENIAFFYTRYEASTIVCMDRKEYPLDHSLDQIQRSLTGKQFFRVNRQCLVNFNAIKEVEHYFARKLLATLVIPTTEKLIVPREKTRLFLDWLANR